MTLRTFLESIGLIESSPPVKKRHCESQDKLTKLEEEHKKALNEVEMALRHQKAASEHVSGIAQKQADDAENALKALRGILRRSIGG